MSLTNLLGFLSPLLGWVVKFLYDWLGNYGWSIILFTFIIRILMFPVTILTQKSAARNAAYQPMMDEIRKKWAKDQNRMNEELMKFQKENNMKMSAGCAPMLVNLLVMFSIIAVVQAPLKYIVQVPAEQVTAGIDIVRSYDPERSEKITPYIQESVLIGEMRANPERFQGPSHAVNADGKKYVAEMDPEYVEAIQNFNFDFLGINLSGVPSFSFNSLLILPLLSLLTSVGVSVITQKTSGQALGGSMFWSMIIMNVVFMGYYAFIMPVGFPLYYTVSNVAMLLQQLLAKKIYDPVKEKEKVLAEIEERKKAKKAKKTIVEKDAKGNEKKREVTSSELARLRLAKARELDAAQYADEITEPVSAMEEEPAEEKASPEAAEQEQEG